ncbi:hypothetical protein M5D96_013938 [Drosophila gunungcola]|uniref:Uncharacterized protein n=1 Tax=Drosophila gunungcola TaxID=103775 RepID=A0A9Q0BJ41_9MUSC|nr:hypothetical protein M5D96_013938 [Drosophila gunungcola]
MISPEIVVATQEHGQQERVEEVSLPAGDMLEKGPWVWPEPVAHPRPIPKRQHSAPNTATRSAFMRQASTSDASRWKEVIQVDWPEGITVAPAVVAVQRRGGKRCVLVQQGSRTFRVRIGPVGVRVFTQ